jgi:hypothetical protein
MKLNRLSWIAVLYVMVPAVVWSQAPHQVGGFRLGEDIVKYKERVKMKTAHPMMFQEYLQEVETASIEGFKSGRIAYGMCDQVGSIVQIKLKYADSSRAFYKKLLNRFKKQFGKPDKWKGDAFHVIISWKWSFVDQDKNRISLTLQHNIKDTKQKLGNTVKLAMTNLIEEERSCFMAKEAETAVKKRPSQAHKLNWDLLIPR